MHVTRKTIDIESAFGTTGEAVILDMERDHVLDVLVNADASTDFQLDRSNGDGDWFEGTNEFTGTDTIAEPLDVGSRFVRLKASTGTGTAGNTAEVLLASSGQR